MPGLLIQLPGGSAGQRRLAPTHPSAMRPWMQDPEHYFGLFSVTTDIDSLSDRTVAGLKYAEL